jgi:hypothetical protein
MKDKAPAAENPALAAAGCTRQEEFGDPLIVRLVAFLREIGMAVRAGQVEEASVLPGVIVEQGGLVVDEQRLRFPGDLLHEAGHLAVSPPGRRASLDRDVGPNPAEEMMAISWSYAAARHIGIDPEIVFHAGGYRGGSDWLLEMFRNENYLALPMLQWCGMAYDKERAHAEGAIPFPKMRCWLREAEGHSP